MRKPVYTWMAFLTMAFAIVGLVGLFGTVATPLPLERALSREATLDDARTAARGPDAPRALEALRTRLDDSADAILPKLAPNGVAASGASVPADIDARIGAERAAMRGRLETEAEAVAARMRAMIVIVTVMGAAFGCVVLRLASNART